MEKGLATVLLAQPQQTQPAQPAYLIPHLLPSLCRHGHGQELASAAARRRVEIQQRRADKNGPPTPPGHSSPLPRAPLPSVTSARRSRRRRSPLPWPATTVRLPAVTKHSASVDYVSAPKKFKPGGAASPPPSSSSTFGTDVRLRRTRRPPSIPELVVRSNRATVSRRVFPLFLLVDSVPVAVPVVVAEMPRRRPWRCRDLGHLSSHSSAPLDSACSQEATATASSSRRAPQRCFLQRPKSGGRHCRRRRPHRPPRDLSLVPSDARVRQLSVATNRAQNHRL
jgi:hypothetical protein